MQLHQPRNSEWKIDQNLINETDIVIYLLREGYKISRERPPTLRKTIEQAT